MTQSTATTPDPASVRFRSVTSPHRSLSYASGLLGRETTQLRDLAPSRDARVMNKPGGKDTRRDHPDHPERKSKPEQPTERPREFGGRRKGLEPTRYGDWEKDGRCIDF
jgi:hypothetical protein